MERILCDSTLDSIVIAQMEDIIGVINVEVIAIGNDAAEEQVVIATVIENEDAPLPNEAPVPFDHGKGDDHRGH